MSKDNEKFVESLLVNVEVAAKMLNISERTLRTITKSGELPVVRIASRVLYSREDLAEFIRERSQRSKREMICIR